MSPGDECRVTEANIIDLFKAKPRYSPEHLTPKKPILYFLSASHEIRGICLILACLIWGDLLYFFGGGVHVLEYFLFSKL